MYLVWKADFDNEPVYTRASLVNAKMLAGIKITACRPLMGQLQGLSLEITSEFPPADYFSAGPLFIVSEKLRTVFDGFGANIEYHPVVLLRGGLKLDCGEYFFANLLEQVDCFDFDKGKYSLDGELIDTIQELAIDEKKANGRHVFRLAKAYDVITLVSHELAGALLNMGLTGVKFVEPSNWRW